MKLSRRGMLRLAVSGSLVAATGALGFRYYPRLDAALERQPEWAWLGWLFLPYSSSLWYPLGARCRQELLRLGSAEQDQEVLVSLWRRHFWRTLGSLDAVRYAFERRIARDYAEGRILVVDDWVLSHTQAVIAMALRDPQWEDEI